jgi:hypothetical protein
MNFRTNTGKKKERKKEENQDIFAGFFFCEYERKCKMNTTGKYLL